MERTINERFIITEEEETKGRLCMLTKEETDMQEIEDYILSNPNNIYIFDRDLKVTNIDNSEAKIAWLDTGKLFEDGEPIMISLLRKGDYYEGYYVGTPKFLVYGMCDRFPGRSNILRTNLNRFSSKYNKKRGNALMEEHEDYYENLDNLNYSSVTNDIYQNLLYTNWKSKKGLERYIKIIGTRIKQLISMKKEEYYVLNNIRDVVINTGMMNKAEEDIYVMYRLFEKQQDYIADHVIQGKTDFIEHGFSKEQSIKVLEPIRFIDEEKSIFNITEEEVDITQSSIRHIIQERKERFPEKVQGMDDALIFSKLKHALSRGIKMQKRDSTFAKPSYSGETGMVSWFMPFHIDALLNEEPELVIAIQKNENFYEVKTILPYDDDTKDKITALSLYNGIAR